ncbi:L-alanine exporter AlaE [Candidatus Woesearchaeota archaeon]|nr:L-alanine exporter AlaE [Candidatus Woesearchaeota archaeon]
MGLQDLVNKTRQHVTDSAALFAVSTPCGAFLENVLAGMADEVSLKSRLIVGGLYLAGIGGALGYGRDISKKLCSITDETKERYQQIHDMVYIGAATVVVNPPIYIAAGAKDFKEIAIGTLCAAAVACASGGIMGYSVDLFRDLTGYKPSSRVPKKVQKARPSLKKALAAGVFTAAMGLAGLVYYITPH